MASKADQKPFYFPDHAVTPVNQGSAPTNPHQPPQTVAFILRRKKLATSFKSTTPGRIRSLATGDNPCLGG